MNTTQNKALSNKRTSYLCAEIRRFGQFNPKQVVKNQHAKTVKVGLTTTDEINETI